MALANLYWRRGRDTDAIEAYQQAIERRPGDASLWLALGQVYLDRGHDSQALAAFEQTALLMPALATAWLGQGDVYAQQGNVLLAQAAYEQARELAPYNVLPLLRLARLFLEQHDVASAKCYVHEALGVAPFNGAAHEILAQILTSEREFEAAIASYLMAMQLNPRLLSAFENWVRLQHDIGLRRACCLAQTLAEIARSPDANTLWGHITLAVGLWRLEGPTDEVLGHLSAALDIDPLYVALYERRALLHEERGQTRLALTDWHHYLYAMRWQDNPLKARTHIEWLLQARIESPQNGERVSGVVAVGGTARLAEAFQCYKVAYRAVGVPQAAWVAIGEGVGQPVQNGRLAAWPTAALVPGAYGLRLTVVDKAGRDRLRDEITVFI